MNGRALQLATALLVLVGLAGGGCGRNEPEASQQGGAAATSTTVGAATVSITVPSGPPATISVPDGAASTITIPTPTIPPERGRVVTQPGGAKKVELVDFSVSSAALDDADNLLVERVALAAVAGHATVTVQAFVSAEGTHDFNRWLLAERAINVVAELRRHAPALQITTLPGSVLGSPDDAEAIRRTYRKVEIVLIPRVADRAANGPTRRRDGAAPRARAGAPRGAAAAAAP